MRKLLVGLLLFLLCFSFSFSYAFSSSFIWTDDTSSVSTSSSSTTPTTDLALESESAILIEQNSGKVLYEHHSHEQLRPASVTKVMSILLIMEALDSGRISLDTTIPCSENASSMGGSQIWLEENESLTVDEMLKAICLNSANDCVYAMAEHLAGSEEEFVTRMNNKAKSLGMLDTTFKNTNKLVRNYGGCTGLKTGSTSLALFNLSASATRDRSFANCRNYACSFWRYTFQRSSKIT